MIVSSDGQKIGELSSTTPLASGASFTSPWIKVDGSASIRVGCLTTQVGELHTQHSNDNGLTIMRDSLQPIVANKAEYLSFHPRAQYFRVVMKNTGLIAQTSLDLSTHISDFALNETQSLVSATLARTSLATQARAMLYDYKYDTLGTILPGSRDLLMASRNSLVADAFTGPLDTANWNTTATGTGTAVINNQRLRMETGATANSTVKFQSAQVARFIAGNISGFKAGIETPDTGVANNIRRWGAYDANNGYFFELNGTTLNAVGRINGTDTRVAANAWSMDNTFVLAANDIHSFEISYFADVAYFIIDDEVKHIMFNQGFKGSFPVTFENNNSGGSTSDVIFYVRGAIAQRYGPSESSPRYIRLSGAATTTIKFGSGKLHRVICGNDGIASGATIYDNTAGSGTVIGVISVNKAPVTLEYGCNFSTGLTFVTTGASSEMTVIYD